MLSQDFSQSTGNPAYLAHLTDIWIILTHICVFIFCSMWLEKTKAKSQSPRRCCKVLWLDNLCWSDPIFLQAMESPSKKACQLKQSADFLQLFTSILSLNNTEAKIHSLKLWSSVKTNEKIWAKINETP